MVAGSVLHTVVSRVNLAAYSSSRTLALHGSAAGEDHFFFSSFANNENKERIDANQAIKMVGTSNKVADVSEDASVSDSMSGGSDDRTIPFLR